MLKYAEAFEKVLSYAQCLPKEEVDLDQLLGRYLAEPLTAPFDLPRFDNSAVDGFGVLLEDVKEASAGRPARLTLTGTIHAGDGEAHGVLKRGESTKILTGAAVPPSVEAVIMREYCREDNGDVFVETSANPGDNIRRRGDELRKGDVVLEAGTRVTPPVVGLLASFGQTSFPVHRQPRVAIVVTGNELVKPGETLHDAEIYESNSFALKAALRAMGLPDCQTVHARDNREAILEAFSGALRHCDIIISAGGVSVGEHDFVKTVLEEDLKVNSVFWKVAIKPGKPVYFAYADERDQRIDETDQYDYGHAVRKLIFGLPGNPVSALVTFHLFVKPVLRLIQGARACQVEPWTAVSLGHIKKKPGRMDFVRGILSCSPDAALQVLPTRGQDSHMLSGLATADCLINFPLDDERLEKGERAHVQRLDWHI
jgi:molybdopterin molybdotransferase